MASHGEEGLEAYERSRFVAALLNWGHTLSG